MTRKSAFPPIVDADTRLLILGSLPGEASLAAGQYYAHPRNGFWRLVGGVIDRPLADMAYPDRLAVLRAHGIGLWDVIARAERVGSLDTAIRLPEAADLSSLIVGLTELKAIAFNGGKAAKLGRVALGDLPGITLIDLPSSSPAHARPLVEKAERWSVLRTHITMAAPCGHVTRRIK